MYRVRTRAAAYCLDTGTLGLHRRYSIPLSRRSSSLRNLMTCWYWTCNPKHHNAEPAGRDEDGRPSGCKGSRLLTHLGEA